jgi:hypothetical protein
VIAFYQSCADRGTLTQVVTCLPLMSWHQSIVLGSKILLVLKSPESIHFEHWTLVSLSLAS